MSHSLDSPRPLDRLTLSPWETGCCPTVNLAGALVQPMGYWYRGERPQANRPGREAASDLLQTAGYRFSKAKRQDEAIDNLLRKQTIPAKNLPSSPSNQNMARVGLRGPLTRQYFCLTASQHLTLAFATWYLTCVTGNIPQTSLGLSGNCSLQCVLVFTFSSLYRPSLYHYSRFLANWQEVSRWYLPFCFIGCVRWLVAHVRYLSSGCVRYLTARLTVDPLQA